MKIVYVGNFNVDFSTETHIKKALEEMGHTVIPLQENRHDSAAVERAVATHGPDLFLWTRTWGIEGDPHGMLSRMTIPTVAYHLDLYAGIARWHKVKTDPWWRCDYVFTPDGGSDPFWAQHGINHVFQPPGVYGAECYMAEPDHRKRHDVIFVGSTGYHPEWPYRPKLVKWLGQTYGQRFGKYGQPENTIRGHELNVLYASSKVVVGDSLCLNFKHPYYWSDRVFETIGRGGFIIHPWIEGMDEWLVDGKHLVYYPFNDFKRLKELIDHYVEHDEEREAIRKAGHEHVKKTSTYTQRMETMLDVVKRGGK